MAERELRPAGRYEWEQILRRARLTGVVTGTGRVGADGRRATRGGVSATTFKAVAFAIASYGNDRGGEIWPGDATIAVDVESSIETVAKVRKTLLALGLLERVGGRRGDRGQEHRLTLPSDLLDSLEVPTPAAHKLAARRLNDALRRKSAGSGGGSTDPGLLGPAEGADGPEAEISAGSGGPHEIGSAGSGGPPSAGSAGPPYPPLPHQGRTTDQPTADLDTAVTVPRARDSPAGECDRHRGFKAGTRADGSEMCTVCRRDARKTPEPPTDPPCLRLIEGGAA